MSILAWIVLGLLAGLIARALLPGAQPAGLILTTLLGIGGALVGGFVGSAITGRGLDEFSIWSLVLAVVGSMLILWLYSLATRSRRATAP